MDLCESIQSLGLGLSRARSSAFPRYEDMLQMVYAKLGWNADEFRGYRCEMHYPPYGAQVVMAWDTIAPPR